MEEQRDQRLWQIAKKRAGFKQHLFTYICVNVFLWAVWFFTHDQPISTDPWPWPVWVNLIWGIFVVMDYFEAYAGGDKNSMAENEYEKLKRRQQGQ